MKKALQLIYQHRLVISKKKKHIETESQGKDVYKISTNQNHQGNNGNLH